MCVLEFPCVTTDSDDRLIPWYVPYSRPAITPLFSSVRRFNVNNPLLNEQLQVFDVLQVCPLHRLLIA